MKWILALFFSLAATVHAQGDFRVCFSSEVLLEGGRVDKLIVVTSNLQFNIRPPKNWYREVEESSRRITFTSPSGKSALAVQFRTNSPGILPDAADLRAQVLRDHAGAGVVQRAICPSGYRPGVLFDLVRVPAPQVVQRTRHAFVAEPGGRAEFILTSSDDEFQKNSSIFMDVVRDFRVDQIEHK